MSQPPLIDATACPADSSLPNPSDVARASLVLLHELETSLAASQRALLRSDVTGMETGTREQRRLQRALEILWAANRFDSRPSESAGQLRAAQMRVLYLGRVQVVLLRRAQQSLVVLGNLLAGTEASYRPAARASWIPIDRAR